AAESVWTRPSARVTTRLTSARLSYQIAPVVRTGRPVSVARSTLTGWAEVQVSRTSRATGPRLATTWNPGGGWAAGALPPLPVSLSPAQIPPTTRSTSRLIASARLRRRPRLRASSISAARRERGEGSDESIIVKSYYH